MSLKTNTFTNLQKEIIDRWPSINNALITQIYM